MKKNALFLFSIFFSLPVFSGGFNLGGNTTSTPAPLLVTCTIPGASVFKMEIHEAEVAITYLDYKDLQSGQEQRLQPYVDPYAQSRDLSISGTVYFGGTNYFIKYEYGLRTLTLSPQDGGLGSSTKIDCIES